MRNRENIDSPMGDGQYVRPLSLALRTLAVLMLAVLLGFAVNASIDESGEEETSIVVHDEGRRIDWGSLPKSIVAWVEVPGTSIDEPIAQATPDNPDRYLYADALGKGWYGTPYIDCDCTVDSPFVAVYGHHMSNGTVFADFAEFSDRCFAESHRQVFVYTRADNKCHQLDVIAADVINASNELLQLEFKDDAEREAYLEETTTSSLVTFDRESLSGRQVWAFVTCSYQTRNSRTTVYCTGGTLVQSLERQRDYERDDPSLAVEHHIS